MNKFLALLVSVVIASTIITWLSTCVGYGLRLGLGL